MQSMKANTVQELSLDSKYKYFLPLAMTFVLAY